MNLINKLVKPVLAQAGSPLGSPLEGIGPLGQITNQGAGSAMLTKAISLVLGLFTITGGIWFLIQIVTAGFQFITANNDHNKIKDAQQKILNALIGLMIIVSAIFLLSLAGTIFHINFLDIPGAINLITP